jgi:hypothetical protein
MSSTVRVTHFNTVKKPALVSLALESHRLEARFGIRTTRDPEGVP